MYYIHPTIYQTFFAKTKRRPGFRLDMPDNYGCHVRNVRTQSILELLSFSPHLHIQFKKLIRFIIDFASLPLFHKCFRNRL